MYDYKGQIFFLLLLLLYWANRSRARKIRHRVNNFGLIDHNFKTGQLSHFKSKFTGTCIDRSSQFLLHIKTNLILECTSPLRKSDKEVGQMQPLEIELRCTTSINFMTFVTIHFRFFVVVFSSSNCPVDPRYNKLLLDQGNYLVYQG